MFTCQRKVFLKEVDATGAIYFTSLFHYAQETLELFLSENKTSLKEFFLKGYQFPIVHAEADYSSRLGVSDEMSLSLSVKAIGESSITFLTEVMNLTTAKVAGKVTLIHVFLQKGEKKASKIPEELISLFHRITDLKLDNPNS